MERCRWSKAPANGPKSLQEASELPNWSLAPKVGWAHCNRDAPMALYEPYWGIDSELLGGELCLAKRLGNLALSFKTCARISLARPTYTE
jgi:hypothetical protein